MEAPLGTIIRQARKARGMTLAALGQIAGVSAQAAGQWERGDNMPSTENLGIIARELGFDPIAALAGEVKFVASPEDVNEVEPITDGGRPDVGPMTVEVLGVTAGGNDEDDDDFYLNGEVVDVVRRPPGIANAKNVLALHVIGTSMVPRYEPGELIYCGGRGPVPNDYVVIELMPPEGRPVGRSYIKKLLRRSGGRIICEQFNPVKELVFEADRVRRVLRIIPWRELLGF